MNMCGIYRKRYAELCLKRIIMLWCIMNHSGYCGGLPDNIQNYIKNLCLNWNLYTVLEDVE